MTIFVKHEPNGRYSWVVTVGRGRGSRKLSRHYKKSEALKSGRIEAKSRGTTLKQQMAQTGQWRTVRSY